jgi:hypothetical protein
MRQLQEAVRLRSPDAILALVRPEGMDCIDSVVSVEKMRRDLTTKGTLLHSYLFDESTYREKSSNLRDPMSLAEFLRVAKDVVIVVGHSELEGVECAQFETSNVEYKPGVCFFKEHGRWYLYQSLYPCGA